MNVIRTQSNTFPTILVYVFVFQNLLNAGSPFITLTINALFGLVALSIGKFRFKTIDNQITLSFSFIITAWLLVVMLYRGGEFEAQILMKYSRSFLTILLAYFFVASAIIRVESLVSALTFALGFHVCVVLLQIPFPDLTQVTAPMFGFDREASILEQYALRKLGASSSYDTASFFSASAAMFFYLRYKSSGQRFFFFYFGAALMAGMMSSRTGMIMTFALMLYVCIREIIEAGPVKKLVFGTGLLGALIFSYLVLYPLLLHSLGIQELDSDEVSFVFAAVDYGTTGSLQALSGDYLEPLKRPIQDLLMGYAVDPNAIGRFSDIGYVKFIYHVGIIGTFIIVLLHFWMMATTRIMLLRCNLDRPVRDLGIFLLWLIGAGLLFNYKSLELYSRGTGDLIIILFYFFVKYCRSSGSLKECSNAPG